MKRFLPLFCICLALTGASLKGAALQHAEPKPLTASRSNAISDFRGVVAIYPNPVVHTLSIDLREVKHAQTRLSLLNAIFKPVKEGDFQQEMVEWDLSDLPDGVYFIRFQSGEDRYVHRIIKSS